MNEIKYKAWLKKEKVLVDVLKIDFQNKEIEFAPIGANLNSFSQVDDYYAVLQTKSFNEIELLQYIGLNDNKNREIYEGYILKYIHGMYGYKSTYSERISVVEYDLDGCFEPFTSSDNFNYEIIGNIYENPELIGGKK